MQEQGGNNGRAANHAKPPRSGAKKALLRKRTALACEECRLRKRRCDGTVPVCGACMKRMTECIYASELQAREWQRSMIQSLKARLEDLESGEVYWRATARGNKPIANVLTPVQPLSPGISTTYSTPAPGAASKSLADAIGPSGESPTIDEMVITGNIGDVVQTEEHTDNVTSVALSTSGPSISAQHGSPPRCIEPDGFERLMRPIDLAMETNGDATSNAQRLSARLVTLPSSPDATIGCSCGRLLDAMRFSLPLRRRADSLVAIYFSRPYRMNPVLHEPTFMKQYERLWESKVHSKMRNPVDCSGFCKQKSMGSLFPATVQAVLALGALFETPSLEQNATRAEAFFQLVQGVDFFATLENEVGIELVQLGLLMGLYLQSTERFSKCWNISGLTMRMAQNMGLHFSIPEARRRRLFVSCPTQLDCEMRTRVWYGCVLLETEISLSFGQPLVVPPGGKSTPLPEAIDDTILSEEAGNGNAQPAGLPSLIEFFVHKIKLYKILGQVLERQYSNSWNSPQEATSSIQATLDLDSQILEWYNRLPPSLKYVPHTLETTVLDQDMNAKRAVDLQALSQRLYSRFLHVRQLILRPALEMFFAKQQMDDSRIDQTSATLDISDAVISHVALQCVESALTLVEFLAIHIDSYSFACWWDNISYLYTSGSTILMGRFCRFKDGKGSQESFSASWNKCLQYLTRYDQLSSIAAKSSRLLQESAQKLLARHCQQMKVHRSGKAPQPPDTQQSPVHGFGDDALHSIDNSIKNSLSASYYNQGSIVTPYVDPLPQAGQDEDQFQMQNNHFWDIELTGVPIWPFMPPISQLETFPLDLNIPDLA